MTNDKSFACLLTEEITVVNVEKVSEVMFQYTAYCDNYTGDSIDEVIFSQKIHTNQDVPLLAEGDRIRVTIARV